jgi:TetR/AcrR family transcriptional regulator, lmrAB and yxaGH operons repressor
MAQSPSPAPVPPGSAAAPAGGTARPSRGAGARRAFVEATAELLRRQGYAASGVNEIVTRSGAPRGSLYFHFPGGKEELAVAAIEASGDQLARAIGAVLSSTDDLAAALGALVDALAAGLEASAYADGCPVATVALEAASTSEPIRAAADRAFTSCVGAGRGRRRAACAAGAGGARGGAAARSGAGRCRAATRRPRGARGARLRARRASRRRRGRRPSSASPWDAAERPTRAVAGSGAPPQRPSRARSTGAVPRRGRTAR